MHVFSNVRRIADDLSSSDSQKRAQAERRLVAHLLYIMAWNVYMEKRLSWEIQREVGQWWRLFGTYRSWNAQQFYRDTESFIRRALRKETDTPKGFCAA